MSYAEQFFGTKQNLVLQYAENLAFFGEESYVYKNAELMKEVIANEVALLNPTTAYYAYLWARENGLAAIDYFKKGLVIAIYHSELNATYHFVLVDFNDDGSAKFINSEPCIFCPLAAVSDGLEVLNYEDYEIIQYLNSDINWYEKWTNKPASTQETIATNDTNILKNVRKKNGFLTGLDYKLKTMLKTFKEGYDFPILTINSDDLTYMAQNFLEYRRNFKTINENCYNFYKIFAINGNIPANIKIGGSYFGTLIDEVTADQISARPTYRAGWDPNGSYVTLERAQTGTLGVCASINNSHPVNLKIQF